MKKYLFYLMVLSFVFYACDKNEETEDTSYVVETSEALIVNYGSYNSTVGSISGFDINGNKMHQYVFEATNGHVMNGKPQYAYTYKGKMYFMGNNLDEIYFVDNNTLVQSKNGISEKIIKPRYCIGHDNYLYISCYGGNVWEDKTLGYIAKYDIKSNKVVKTINIPGGPEGLEIANGNLYVALNYAKKIAILNLSSEQLTYIETPSVSSYFLKDDSNNLYVSLLDTYTVRSDVSGLGYINTNTNELAEVYNLPNVSSNYSSIISFNSNKSAIYIAASSWIEEPIGNWVQKGGVFKFDVETKSFGTEPYIGSIDGLNAISVNPSTDDLYVLISESTTTTGELKVYNKTGEYVSNYQTGITPAWVMYR